MSLLLLLGAWLFTVCFYCFLMYYFFIATHRRKHLVLISGLQMYLLGQVYLQKKVGGAEKGDRQRDSDRQKQIKAIQISVGPTSVCDRLVFFSLLSYPHNTFFPRLLTLSVYFGPFSTHPCPMSLNCCLASGLNYFLAKLFGHQSHD